VELVDLLLVSRALTFSTALLSYNLGFSIRCKKTPKHTSDSTTVTT
jgi:hypothetical protein